MVLMVSMFFTGLVTYQMWMKREDKTVSVRSFKTHLKYMESDIENLTKWNRDLNESLNFMITDNEVMNKLEKEYGSKDSEIKAELSELQQKEIKLTRDVETW